MLGVNLDALGSQRSKTRRFVSYDTAEQCDAAAEHGSGQGQAPQYEDDYHDANDRKDRSRKPIHGGSPVREYGQGPGCGTKVTEGSGPFPAVPKRPLKF